MIAADTVDEATQAVNPGLININGPLGCRMRDTTLTANYMALHGIVCNAFKNLNIHIIWNDPHLPITQELLSPQHNAQSNLQEK